MTWEIFLGIVALVGFVGSVGLWISKLSKVLTTLEVAIKALTEFKSDSKAEHKEMHDKINDHETRIEILEIKVDNRPKK